MIHTVKMEGKLIMNYTRVVVATTNGMKEVMTGEMRTLMKNGIKRTLIPLKNSKKTPLNLDKYTKSEISSLNKRIKGYEWDIRKLELKKSQPDISTSQIAELDAEIEHLQFKIFETQSRIRDIKVEFYKNQTSTIDLDA